MIADTAETAALAPAEKKRRDQLEAKVTSGLEAAEKTGLGVCRALEELRDRRLYRETHASFAAYVEDRFGVGRSRAYQLLDWAKVSTRVGAELPNELIARELGALPEDL